MKVLVVAILMLGLAACGPKEKDVTRAKELMFSTDVAESAAKASEDLCNLQLPPVLERRHAEWRRTAGQKATTQQAAAALMDTLLPAARAETKSCADAERLQKEAAEDRELLRIFCATHLEACEQVRRLQAVTR